MTVGQSQEFVPYSNYQSIQWDVVDLEAHESKEENLCGTGCFLGCFLSIFGLLYLGWEDNQKARKSFIKGWVLGALIIPSTTFVVLWFGLRWITEHFIV